MTEVQILLRPLPDSDWIKQDPAFSRSAVSFAEEAEARRLTVVSVRLNGAEIPFRVIGRTTVQLTPMLRLEGDRLVIVCSEPKPPDEERPRGGFNPHPATTAAPDYGYGYGLQRAANLPMKQIK